MQAVLAVLALIFIVVAILVVLYLIWICIRIFLTLVRAFAMVILLVMFAPVIILLGALTTRGGFGMWLRTLISNLAVFPIVGFMFQLAIWFCIVPYGLIGAELGLPTPAFVPDPNIWGPPLLLGDNFIGFLWLGISFIIFVNIPRAADIIRSAMAGQPYNFGTALRESLNVPGAGFAQEQIVGRGTIAAAQRAYTGGTGANWLDRTVANYARRRGYIDIPSPGGARRKGDVSP